MPDFKKMTLEQLHEMELIAFREKENSQIVYQEAINTINLIEEELKERRKIIDKKKK